MHLILMSKLHVKEILQLLHEYYMYNTNTFVLLLVSAFVKLMFHLLILLHFLTSGKDSLPEFKK